MILVTVCISLLYATLYFSEFGGKVNMLGMRDLAECGRGLA
jgi:hypothetical protein